MTYKNLIIVFDWVGSLLMLGTLWAWMYSKFAPRIKRRLTKAERRIKAFWRVLAIRHGERFPDDPFLYGKDSFFQIRRNYRSKLGITSEMPFIDKAIIQAKTANEIEENYKRNQSLENEYQELQNYRKARKEINLLLLRYGFIRYKFEIQSFIFKTTDAFTFSVFSGRVGFILFVLGFVLWNLSKGLSLFTP